MSAQEEEFLRSLRATFRVEAAEHLQTIATGLLALEGARSSWEEQRRQIETMFRAAHSLKGASRAVNLTEIESICQSLENTFAVWKRQEAMPVNQEVDALHRLLDRATRALNTPDAQTAKPGIPEKARSCPEIPVLEERPTSDQTGLVKNVSAQPPSSLPLSGTEKSTNSETIRISVTKLNAQLLEAEEMLAVKLTAAQRAEDVRGLVKEMDSWSKEWAGVQPALRALRRTFERAAAGQKDIACLSDLTKLIEFTDWNRDYFRSFEGKIGVLRQLTEQDNVMVGRLVDELLADSKNMLMLPMSTLGAMFPKFVRDLCRDQGKEADLIIRGEEFEIDKRILEAMKDPFIHLLRNCIDHGIEKPEVRTNLGKPRRATISIVVVPVNGNKVELLVSDDGHGIDPEKVKAAAIKSGLILEEQAQRMTESEILALIFQADVSTSPMITELSGRGLGLAIVREQAEKLGGRVSVDSKRLAGTTIRINLPVTVATFRGILIEVSQRQFVVPTAQVDRVERFKTTDVQTVEGQETLSLRGRAVSLVRMAQVLALPPAARISDPAAAIPVVILGAGDHRVAFAVDAVLDEQEVLVKRFTKPLARVRNISGATVLGSGRVAPILNVADLLKSARKFGRVASPTEVNTKPVEARTSSILVAEDSITSRMLLKGILESAGFQVKTAVDGLEAFTILRTQEFDLVISDVEMPRLNGFDLTARIRADQKLAELPVILVTALDSREDRERGVDAGANAYLVKSSFDQSNLLEAVRRLI